VGAEREQAMGAAAGHSLGGPAGNGALGGGKEEEEAPIFESGFARGRGEGLGAHRGGAGAGAEGRRAGASCGASKRSGRWRGKRRTTSKRMATTTARMLTALNLPATWALFWVVCPVLAPPCLSPVPCFRRNLGRRFAAVVHEHLSAGLGVWLVPGWCRDEEAEEGPQGQGGDDQGLEDRFVPMKRKGMSPPSIVLNGIPPSGPSAGRLPSRYVSRPRLQPGLEHTCRHRVLGGSCTAQVVHATSLCRTVGVNCP